MEQGVKFDVSVGSELDFGPGFYLAPDKKMAEEFMFNQIKFKREQGLEGILPPEAFIPVVIEFEFSPYSYWENGEVKVLDVNNEEFATFITDNRIRAHEGLTHKYPLIYGIMSDKNPAILVSKFNSGELSKEEVISMVMEKTISTRQISIHKQDICDILKPSKAYLVDGGKELDINGYRNSK